MLIVFGSINMDMIVTPNHLPRAGETVLCDDYDLQPGGKGANQALAACRMGARVALVGCAGGDNYSRQVLETVRRQGVMTSGVSQSDDYRTGCAMIMREKGGQNRIIVAAGANNEIQADQVPDEILRDGNMVLTQTEIPGEQVFALIRRAHERGVRVVLNLAPAIHVPLDVLKLVHVLVVNEIEIDQLSTHHNLAETDPAALVVAIARKAGIICIGTLAEKGSVVARPDGTHFRVSALPEVEVIDTTGAGDAYCGTLTACLYSGMTLEDSVRWASAAGSLACTKYGTLNAFAFQGEIREKLPAIEIIS